MTLAIFFGLKEFKKLPAETQKQIKKLMNAQAKSPRDIDTIAQLAKTEGFNKLSADEQKRFLNYIGGANKEISTPARCVLANTLNDPAVDKSKPETFRDF